MVYGSGDNKKIIKHDNIQIENDKILINKKSAKKICTSRKEKKLINYCPLSVCEINKQHFHILGTNIICGCVRTMLTFFISN
ncbi:putative orfan [Tupanvirus soda lake]|uniref:Orfan n=2 Tax=Tupanvirus TaxID=2094720 RepID=A0AC62ABA0_9VIRU|nr:putative orfan [Tupanvirus soda lake]QKU35019.1 putative orfan [Tupanvirus soda lake]